MEYGIKELAKLTGITTRTLRYYDEIDLLKPSRIGDNGYRFYDSKELEILQQIMFYRKRGFELKKIKAILSDPGYDIKKALKEAQENPDLKYEDPAHEEEAEDKDEREQASILFKINL